MDYIAVLSIKLVFGGIGLGIGYVLGYRKGVERERLRQREEREQAV